MNSAGTGGMSSAGTGGMNSAGSGGTAGVAGSGGTGGSNAGSLLGGCNSSVGHYCDEFTGPQDQAAALKDMCELTQRVWQATCSTSNVLGSCEYTYGAPQQGVTAVTRYYKDLVGVTADDLKKSCEEGLQGTWTNGS